MKKLFLVFLASIFLSGCNRLDFHQPLTTTSPPLTAGTTVSQTFRANHNNLNIVSICLRNHERIDMPLRFSLSEAGHEVRFIDFSSHNIDNTDCTRFQFAPLTDSGGRTFTASIIALPTQTPALIPLVVGVEKHGTDLHFKTHYYQSPIDAVKESWSQFVYRLTQDLAFLIPYLLLLGGIIYLCGKKFPSRSSSS